jgi:alkylated DNA nucleotide flippase Atl1
MPLRQIRRAKVFTDGRQAPIDPNDRARVIALAESARRAGRITRAAVDVLRALLFKFANLKDGRCFPSYIKIAEAAGCCAKTVGRALTALERAGLISWVNRIRKVRESVPGLGEIGAWIWRVVRTSNSYGFPAIAKKPCASPDKGQKGRGTKNPDSNPSLLASLDRLKKRVGVASRPLVGRIGPA